MYREAIREMVDQLSIDQAENSLPGSAASTPGTSSLPPLPPGYAWSQQQPGGTGPPTSSAGGSGTVPSSAQGRHTHSFLDSYLDGGNSGGGAARGPFTSNTPGSGRPSSSERRRRANLVYHYR